MKRDLPGSLFWHCAAKLRAAPPDSAVTDHIRGTSGVTLGSLRIAWRRPTPWNATTGIEEILRWNLRGFSDTVAWLIDRGAGVTWEDLQDAIRKLDLPAVKLFVRAMGAEGGAGEDFFFYRRAVLAALFYRREDVAWFLLGLSGPSTPTRVFNDPLVMACRKDAPVRIIEGLLARGADPNAEWSTGVTALSEAERTGHADARRVLLAHAAVHGSSLQS